MAYGIWQMLQWKTVGPNGKQVSALSIALKYCSVKNV